MPFIVAGVGMALFFAPVANVVLSAVRPRGGGQASGANNAIRELGGVFGVAVLAAIFAHSAATGRRSASSTGSTRRCASAPAVVALGAVAAFAIPRGRPRAETASVGEALREAA